MAVAVSLFWLPFKSEGGTLAKLNAFGISNEALHLSNSIDYLSADNIQIDIDWLVEIT